MDMKNHRSRWPNEEGRVLGEAQKGVLLPTVVGGARLKSGLLVVPKVGRHSNGECRHD